MALENHSLQIPVFSGKVVEGLPLKACVVVLSVVVLLSLGSHVLVPGFPWFAG